MRERKRGKTEKKERQGEGSTTLPSTNSLSSYHPRHSCAASAARSLPLLHRLFLPLLPFPILFLNLSLSSSLSNLSSSQPSPLSSPVTPLAPSSSSPSPSTTLFSISPTPPTSSPAAATFYSFSGIPPKCAATCGSTTTSFPFPTPLRPQTCPPSGSHVTSLDSGTRTPPASASPTSSPSPSGSATPPTTSEGGRVH